MKTFLTKVTVLNVEMNKLLSVEPMDLTIEMNAFVLAKVLARNIPKDNAHKNRTAQDVMEYSNLFVVNLELPMTIFVTYNVQETNF